MSNTMNVFLFTTLSYLLYPEQSMAEPMPDDYDILGIKLGMSLDEVSETANSQGYELQTEQHMTKEENDSEHLYQYWSTEEGHGDLLIHYTLPPFEPEVMIIKRHTSEQRFYNQHLQNALVDKYGEPTQVSEPSELFDGSATLYMWYHGSDEDGLLCRRLPPPGSKERVNTYGATRNNCTGIQLFIYVETSLTPEGPTFHLYESHLVDYGKMLENLASFENDSEDTLQSTINEDLKPIDPPKL